MTEISKLKIRMIRFLVLGSLTLIIGGWVLLSGVEKPESRFSSVAGLELGGEFSLIDHNGNAVTDQDFTGRYKLIYFGFTYCPAICPTELQKIATALNAVGMTGANPPITPIFITVDPERDRPDVLKDYVAFFHPGLIGLTGTQDNITKTLRDYKIYAAKVENEESTDYTMDHSSFIYLIAPDETLIALFRTSDPAELITQELKKIAAVL